MADQLTEPYVFASTRMPSATVRGEDWKYVWSPEDEELYAFEDEGYAHAEDGELANEDLRAAGSALVEWWRRARAEKEAIVTTAEDLAASGRV